MKTYWLPIAMAAPLVFSGCSPRTEAKSTEPLPVAPVTEVVTTDLTREVALTAEFRPYQEVDVHAKVAGYLKKIYVDVGDRVRQGDLLAVLEIPEMADDLARAKASISLNSSNVQRAREELQRAQAAHDMAHLSYTRLAGVLAARPNLVAQQEIDNAQAGDRASEAQVSAAKAALAAAENQVQVSEADQKKVQTLTEYARITAPFSGVITHRYADTGAMIQAGTASQTQAMPVVRLSQNDLLRLVLPAPESVVPRIRLGDVVTVRVSALNRTFTGRVARFSGKVSTATRTMETEVDVPNPSGILLPGMYAEAVLTTEKHARTLAVPVEAVITGEHPRVLALSPDNTVEVREVRTGIETPTSVEILSGLKRGDRVLVGTGSRFRPGQKVQPKAAGV